jgi:hypothetical protein
MRAFVKEKFSTLNADDLTRAQAKIGLKGLPNFQFEHEGWRVDFYPIPKQEKYRNTEVTRPIGVTGQASASILETWKSIRDSVKDKANKYGAFGYPLVVVVNSMGVHTGKIDVMQALFGQESFTFSPTASETEMHRLGNGVWFGPKGIRYRRLSAVLVLSSLVPWGIGEAGCRLYHNPWTNYPYDGGLCRLPQARPEEDKMKNFSGASLLDLLGLPKGWPAH